MPSERATFVLLNPAAGRGRGQRRIADYLTLLRRYLGAFDQAASERPGHEIALLDDALARGYERIVAVGGDGTWGTTADRIIHSGRRDVALGLLPAGTGNDFGKSIGVRHGRAEAVVRAIGDGRTRRIDVGRIGERHFLNVVGIGFDIAVIDDAATTPVLKGDLLYRFCALRQLFRFPGITLEVGANGGTTFRRQLLMLTISNANYFGGSFHIAPRARLDDGLLDLVAIHDAGPITRARLFATVSKGAHEARDDVTVVQSSAFSIAFEGPMRYEVDGEVFTASRSPLEVSVLREALSVFTPEGAQ